MDDVELAKILKQALRDGLYVPDNLYRFDTKLAWDLTNQAHVREPQRLAVIGAIETHPEIQAILGMQLNSGLNGARLHKESLATWLLTRANQLGPEVAVAEVRALLDNGYLDIEEYLAFSGLETSEPITLPNNIELVPISDIPESAFSISLTDPDWFYFGRNSKGHVIRKSVQILDLFGKKEFHSDPNVAMAAMRIRSRRSPAVVPTATDHTNSRGTMLDALRVLAATTCTAMFPIAHWASASPTTPLWKEGGGWIQWSHASAVRKFTAMQGNKDRISRAIGCWSALSAPMRQKLTIPLERLNRALATLEPVDGAIDLGLSLEALLLTDLAPNDQISLAFRLRGAWLLGKDPTERRTLVQMFNAIYACRSAAVHAGTIASVKVRIGGKSSLPHDFISQTAPRVAADAILKVIERGSFPDWSDLLLGNEAV